MSDDGAAILITRLFTEALDARDLEALRVLVAEDEQFRNREGGTLTGWEGMETVVNAAREADSSWCARAPRRCTTRTASRG